MNPQSPPAQGTAPDSNIMDLLNASRSQFMDVHQFMNQHAFLFDPFSGSFVKNPSYLDPMQQLQLAQGLQNAVPNPNISNYQAAVSAQADNTKQQNSLIPPDQLNQFSDPNTGQPVPYGTTYGGVAGKQTTTPAQQSDLQGLAKAQQMLDQLKAASTKANVASFDNSPIQGLKALEGHLGLDQNARLLMDAPQSFANLFASGALNVNRFNLGEVEILSKKGLPSISMGSKTANAKIDQMQQVLDAGIARTVGKQGVDSFKAAVSSGSDFSNSPSPSAPSPQGAPQADFNSFFQGNTGGGP